MAIEANISFFEGETWRLIGSAMDESGFPFDLTGGQVRLAIGTSAVFDATLTDAANGEWSCEVTPLEQTAHTLLHGVYLYEVRVYLSDGRVSTQNTGRLSVQSSLFTEAS